MNYPPRNPFKTVSNKIQAVFNNYNVILVKPIESYAINSLLNIEFYAHENPPYNIIVGENIIQLEPKNFPITNNGRDEIKIVLMSFDNILNMTVEKFKRIAAKRTEK